MARKSNKTTLLCILDGFGLNPNLEGNAIHMARKPVFDRLFASAPRATLATSGEAVGLPEGQMGNSEVGHMNIGAGRVMEQWLLRISRAMRGDFLDRSEPYKRWIAAGSRASATHVIGLFSDGGVHSHCDHLYLLLERLSRDVQGPIYLHLITDGRDTSPTRGAVYVQELEKRLANFPSAKIATVVGRFYAMDRDKRWERVKRAYDLIRFGEAPRFASAEEAITTSYEKGVTDEFIEPALIREAPLNPEDRVLFWNFREDRMREIVAALCVPEFSGFERTAPIPDSSRVLGFTEYDHSYHLPFLFSPLETNNHLGEVLSNLGYTQLRTAETEKYPHVTYFFNAGIEKPYEGEERVLIPSPREVKTYDQKPQMSAYEVTAVVENALRAQSYDFIVVNLANCDMVGHTGVIEAAVKAVEIVDECVGKMLQALQETGGQAIIIADHGNAEQMINYADGSPHTAHTTCPVPIIAVGTRFQSIENGALCDVAPTILQLMQVPQPPEMTGRALLK